MWSLDRPRSSPQGFGAIIIPLDPSFSLFNFAFQVCFALLTYEVYEHTIPCISYCCRWQLCTLYLAFPDYPFGPCVPRPQGTFFRHCHFADLYTVLAAIFDSAQLSPISKALWHWTIAQPHTFIHLLSLYWFRVNLRLIPPAGPWMHSTPRKEVCLGSVYSLVTIDYLILSCMCGSLIFHPSPGIPSLPDSLESAHSKQSLYALYCPFSPWEPNWPRLCRIYPSLRQSDPSPPSLIIQRHSFIDIDCWFSTMNITSIE